MDDTNSSQQVGPNLTPFLATNPQPDTFHRAPLLNIGFAVLLGACGYFYVLSMLEDPGFVPKARGRNTQRAAIQELLRLWKFDEDNFCMQCMTRRPLRSKHCRRCGRCVAKHDQWVRNFQAHVTEANRSVSHCPWINNCVGVNNHRHFLIFIGAIEAGVILFILLVAKRKKPLMHGCKMSRY